MTKLIIVNKDILTIKKGIIVQQVNSIGKTGAGLSGTINAKYPQVKEHYLSYFSHNVDLPKLNLGDVLFNHITYPFLTIASIVGQQNVGTYKVQTDFNALRKGLQKIVEFNYPWNLPIYVPYFLGSGLGGGPTQQTKQETWEKVSSIIWEEIPNAIICRKI